MNKSFLKWAGGKSKLLKHILPEIDNHTRLIEPFCGSCVVSLNSNCKTIVANDTNSDIIGLFREIKTDGYFIEKLNELFKNTNNSEAYYSFREEFNTTTDLNRKSLLFVYLNRHCFNGLCRYNRSGKFNVPFGRYKTIYFPKDEIELFKKTNISFSCKDFRECFNEVSSGDVIYCDPPYAPLSKTSSFTTYSTGGFSETDQIELAECIMKAPCKVVASNHDVSFIRDIYSGCKFIEVEVQRNISSKNRQKVGEVIIVKE